MESLSSETLAQLRFRISLLRLAAWPNAASTTTPCIQELESLLHSAKSSAAC